jgi:hypothetical protein
MGRCAVLQSLLGIVATGENLPPHKYLERLRKVLPYG